MKNGTQQFILLCTLASILEQIIPSASSGQLSPLQPTPPSPPALQTSKPYRSTPEQEAALVEARTILQEARQVAEKIEPPNRMFSGKWHYIKALEELKNRVLDTIEETQLRAGDITIAPTGTPLHFELFLALAQAHYGSIESLTKTLKHTHIYDDTLLQIVDDVIKNSDTSTALTIAELALAREIVHAKRHRNRAAVLALIARRQHEHNDPAAKTTVQMALQAARDVLAPPEDVFWAFVHVARAQGILGDRAGSAESFQEASRALQAQRMGGYRYDPNLRWLAKAQAEGGDHTASQQTFRRAIESHKHSGGLTCTAWVQSVLGNHPSASQTLKMAVTDAEQLSPGKRESALHDIALWQLKINDRNAALETIGKLRQAGAGNLISLSMKARNWRLAIDLSNELADSRNKASSLAYIAKALAKTKDSFGTREVFQELVQNIVTLIENFHSKDQTELDFLHEMLAQTKAASGDIFSAFQMAKRIPPERSGEATHGRLIRILIDKGALPAATQLIPDTIIEWQLNTSIFSEIGEAYVKSGDTSSGLVWARQLQNPYAEANALRGIAHGILEQQGITDFLRVELDIPTRDSCPTSLLFKFPGID